MADKDSKKNGKNKADADDVSAPAAEDSAADVPPIPPAVEDTGDTAPAPKPRGGGGAFLFGIVLVLLVIGGAVALVMFEPRVNAEFRKRIGISGAAEIAALETRLAAMETRLDALQSRLDGLPVGIDPARVDALEKNLGALPKGVDPARLGTLEGRIDALTSRLDGFDAAAGAAPRAVALVALADRLQSGRPFAALLTRARAELPAGTAADVDALVAYAARGVPTAARLAVAARALPVAERAAAPAGETPADGGLWDRIKARLGGLVTIRRVGEGDTAPASPSSSDLRARAARAFANGDVGAALDVLQKIDPATLMADGRTAYEQVMADARARLTADKLAAAIDAALAASP